MSPDVNKNKRIWFWSHLFTSREDKMKETLKLCSQQISWVLVNQSTCESISYYMYKDVLISTRAFLYGQEVHRQEFHWFKVPEM